MSKIYSAVDAHEAEQFIGKEGYFADSLMAIHQKPFYGVLGSIRDMEELLRFKVKENKSCWTFFQPIEKTDLEIAKGLLGKIMKEKNENRYVIFTEIRETDIGVMLESVNFVDTI